MASPLLGYNNNVRHLGKTYHIQTEDSGTTHGHIFTHLFADGGRIIASKKTTYTQYLGTDRFPAVVKQLMRESHKAMFIALRDGLFDEDEQAGARAITEMTITLEEDAPPLESAPEIAIDEDALERAAASRLAESAAAQQVAASTPPGRYAGTRPSAMAAAPARASRPARAPDPTSESIFGGDLLSEKSLDEVILSYLAEDVEED